VGKTSIVRGAGGKRLVLRHNPLAIACAAAFLLAGQSAWAADEVAAGAAATGTASTTGAEAPQEAAADANLTPEQKEEKRRKEQAAQLAGVKVVGIRRGIENAIDTKQGSTSIVESISAEDIGKLPDSSIAESIARLPGLTAQRERGRATQINIRGFAGDFAGTTLNGREQTSTGDNRGVEFDQYPSELLSAVTVYKTPDASLVGQGLSGTVDLKTARPLDFADRVLSLNFRGDQNDVNGQSEYGNRYSFAYIDQFNDHTLGVSIGYAHLDSPQPGFQNESWGYADGPNGTKVYGGGKLYKFDDNLERDGWMGTVQWKPNDWYEGTVDIFYSQFKKTEVKTGVEFGTAWGQGHLLPGYVTNSAGTITSSDWTNVKPVLRMDSNPIDDQLFPWGWNSKFHINDEWNLDAEISYSTTDRKFDVLETYAGLVGNGGTTTTHVELDSSDPFYNVTFGTDLNDPSNLQLIDAGGWGQDGYLKAFEVEDTLWAYRVDAERKFNTGWLSSIEFGLNYTDRDKQKTSDEAKLCLVACAGVGDHAPFPGESSDFNFGGLDGLAIYDAQEALDSGIWNLQPKYHPDIANKNWSIDEKLTTVYAQFNIDTDVGEDMPLRGNFGFQWVDVDQSSEGFSTFQGNDAGEITSDGTNYSHFLPSLNLSLAMDWEMYLRFGAARQMARPRLDDLRASFNVSINTGNCAGVPGPVWCGSGGNPRLKPWLANAYDLSWEKYFTTEAGNKGYIAAAYWFKDLQTFIYKADVPFDYSGFPLPPDDGTGAYPDSTLGVLNQPFNGEGGIMKGIELTASLPLDVLWGGLNGFGLQASYSDTDSSIEPFGPGSSQPLPGLSKYVSNLTVYWERWGFSLRASQRTRSAFLGETRGFGADLAFININGEKVQDVQANYTFQPGNMFEGLSLYLQISNIGDEPFTTSDAGDPDSRPIQYFEYGRTTLLGFSYKF